VIQIKQSASSSAARHANIFIKERTMKHRISSTLGIVLAALFATAITACSGSSSDSGGGNTCAATAITPYIYTNGAWIQEASATVTSNSATVDLGPQPVSGGSWSWSGPNGFTSTAREIDAIKLSAGTNTYTATYTNSCGTSSTQTFTITMALAPGDYNETITSVGESRTFILHIPTGYTGNTAMPAILDFHPFGVDAGYMEGMSGWKGKCDTVGCIVVYPQGDNNAWNAGYCCGGGPDDVQFGRDIITWLKANTNLDAQRVYATGGSNGGAMTYAMACEASDVIAAAAAVDFRCVTGSDPGAGGATMPPSDNTACTCPNIRPITIVEWEEEQDTGFVLYQGGVASTGLGLVGAVANIETFGYFSGCTGSPTPDPDNSLCETWTSCKDGVTETLCNHQSGSHLATYWDSSDHWNDVSWDRISVQSLPLPK
jgi:poly(3-hydroxybutyrate) depolymerase